MSEILTKTRARNIFYGGSIFFAAVFGVMSLHSHKYIVNKENDGMELSEDVIRGKHIWERHACINCHTLYGEGAYFAPELGNIMARWNVLDDPEAAAEILGGWMEAQPSGAEGRRQMPYFKLTEEETRALAEFLRWAGHADLQGWPPHDAG